MSVSTRKTTLIELLLIISFSSYSLTTSPLRIFHELTVIVFCLVGFSIGVAIGTGSTMVDSPIGTGSGCLVEALLDSVEVGPCETVVDVDGGGEPVGGMLLGGIPLLRGDS